MIKKKTVKSKVVKKKAALARKDKAKDSEILATTTHNGKKVNIEKWHIAGISILPTCISGSDELDEEKRATLELKFLAVKAALKSNSKDLQDEVIDTILGDLVAGAYQDKLIAYTRVPSGHSKNSLEALKEIQRVRQAADTHLLNIVKAVRDIKRPPVNVVVKQADQVNVAEQINQADKQVNIAKNQQPA
jgi:hypothetical protein